jgi:hypothetical protein
VATITTDTFLDGGTARTAGEAWTCNGGKLTVRTDTRWHANAPASMTGTLAAVTVSAILGGGVLYDGRDVRWMPYDTGTGNVPAIGTTITQGGVSAYLLGVWANYTSAPTAVGAAMPASGFIKFREVAGGPFATGALTGIGASATGPDVAGWIEVVQDNSVTNTISRKGSGHVIRGDWFYLDNTTGTRGQVLQVPTNGGGAGTTAPGVWIETAPASGLYEYWPALSSQTAGNGWLYNHLGMPTGESDIRQRFVKGLGSGQLQIGDTSTPQAATYASTSQVGTYTWANDVVTVTFTAHGLSVGQQVYLDFTSGAATPDGVYTVEQVTGANSYTVALVGAGTGGAVTAVATTLVTFTAHGRSLGNRVTATVSTGTLASGAYEITQVVDANSYRIATPTAPGATGNVSIGSDIGYVPVSGCKIRIPNVFLRHATTAARANNDRTSTAVRPTFTTTGAGAIDHEYAYGDLTYTFLQPYSIRLHHCANMESISISECATAIDMFDGGVSMDLAADVVTLTLTSNFAGGTIEKYKFFRGNAPGTSDHAVSISLCSGQTFTDCESGIVQFGRSSGYSWNLSQSKNLTFTRCRGINGSAFTLTTCTDVAIDDYDYVDRFIGVTNSTSANYVFALSSKCARIAMDGVTEGYSDTIARQHAYSGMLTVAACDDIKLRNCGTRVAPLGTSPVKINDRGVIYASGGNNSGIKIQRCYVSSVRTSILTDVNSDKNVLYESVSAPFLSTWMPYTLTIAALNATVKGVKAPVNTIAANASVYGTHIYDQYSANFRILGTYTWASDILTVTATAHGLQVGENVTVKYTSGGASGYEVLIVRTVTSANVFTAVKVGSGTAGNCIMWRNTWADDDTDFVQNFGRICLPMNEPTVETSPYVTTTGNAQFTSAPGLTLPSSGDSVVFTSQYEFLGHIGFMDAPPLITGAPVMQAVAYTWTANVVTVTFTAHGLAVGDQVWLDQTTGTLPDGLYTIASVTSANVYTISLTGSGTSGNANAYRLLLLEYQLDLGTGYGSWHNLDRYKVGVTLTAASTTVTMADTTGIEVGDRMYATGMEGLPTVVSVDSGTQITIDGGIHLSGTNQMVRFGRLGTEMTAMDAAQSWLGFGMKIRISADTPGTTMALTYVTIPTHTGLTFQDNLFPLDTNTLTLTGLKNPTEIRVFEAGTTIEVGGQETVTSGTFSTQIDAGTYPLVDISILALGYQNTRLLGVSMVSGDVSIPVQQNIDRQYQNT